MELPHLLCLRPKRWKKPSDELCIFFAHSLLKMDELRATYDEKFIAILDKKQKKTYTKYIEKRKKPMEKWIDSKK